MWNSKFLVPHTVAFGSFFFEIDDFVVQKRKQAAEFFLFSFNREEEQKKLRCWNGFGGGGGIH